MKNNEINARNAKKEWLKFGCSSAWNQFLNNEEFGVTGVINMLETSIESSIDNGLFNEMLGIISHDDLRNCTPCQRARLRSCGSNWRYKNLTTKSIENHIDKVFANTTDKIYNGDEIYEKLFIFMEKQDV